ncbi:AAA family ATPase [Candidatus Kaiserbacteria bacterium]|nr:AAA family ATPase [Candidatus Kaiserbacteria bacterium]
MKIIKNIEIKHFRSVFEQGIKELNHFNIFGGQNDSGKSNVLRVLNLFFNNQTSFLEEFDFQSDFSLYSKIKARESKKGRQYISIKIFFDASEIKGKTGLRKLAEANGSSDGLWVERRWWAYSEDGSYEQIVPNFIATADQGIKRSFSVFLQSIKFVYIPAFKSEDVFSYILRLSAQNKGLFLSTTAKNELDSNIAKTTQEFSKDFSDVTGIQTSVTLPISLESFWSSLEVNSQFEGTPSVIKRGDAKDYQIKFTSRGEGIKSLFIPVVLGWLSRKVTAEHWIWGIDEPENALEALRADNLFSKFTEYAKHAQIFVSTHSPSFLFPQDGTDICRVFIAKQDIPGNTAFELLSGRTNELVALFGYDYGSFLRIQEDYSMSMKNQDNLKREIKELKKFINKPAIFVEGPTDKIILENAWATLYPKKELPFTVVDKNNAKSVSYALENSNIFPNRVIFGLFDFDGEGYQTWNGLLSHGYVLDATSTPETCLVLKRKRKKHFALLLPVPATGVVRDQVINPTDSTHYADRSKFTIELMFCSVASIANCFVQVASPGNGQEIRFKGDKMIFAKNTKGLAQTDFDGFKPLFSAIERLSK